MKVLDKSGLSYLWSVIKGYISGNYQLLPSIAYNSSLASVTVPSGQWTVLGSVELSPGRYIGAAYAQIAANATGYRILAFSKNSDSISRVQKATQAGHSGTGNCLNVPRVFTVSETTTFNIYVYQNSGSNLLCYPAYSFFRFPYSVAESEVSTDA